MKHVILVIAMAITCTLAAVANVIVTRMTGLNIFTFKVWFVLPAGAIGVGMLGASGAILAARYFQIQPKIIDATFMVLVAAEFAHRDERVDVAELALEQTAVAP